MRAFLVVTLVAAVSGEEAMAATSGLIEAAEAAANPLMLSFSTLGLLLCLPQERARSTPPPEVR